MATVFETLEGRRLLAGHGVGVAERLLERATAAAEDPAVQATVALVRADQSAIEAARLQLVSDSSDTRQALRQALEGGLERLAADRQAVRDSQGDPAALEAARAKLKADREQLRKDVLAARDALRADTVEARAALKDAVASLRDHLRQLKSDLENVGLTAPPATTPPPAAPPPTDAGTPGGSGQDPGVGRAFAFTPEQAREAVDALNAIADQVSSIDRAAVDTLAAHLVSAAADSELTRDERRQLFDDGRAVLRSISPADVRTIARELLDIVHVRPA